MIPLCQNILDQHFNIIGIFDLVTYRNDPCRLYQDIKSKKKDTFNKNDRLIFTLFDHDFYLDNQGPGWNLYNLQLILKDLDISNFFCLLLVNQPDYDDYTECIRKTLTTDDFPIRSITTMLTEHWVPPLESTVFKESAEELIQHPFCLLSRQSRPHRTFFVSKLWHENLLDKGLLAYNNLLFTDHDLADPNSNKTFCPLKEQFLFYPTSYQRILLWQKSNQEIYAEFDRRHPCYKNFEENLDLSHKSMSSRLYLSTPLQNALLYVGIETFVLLPKPFLTRISLRGIVERRPFVLFANPHSLAFLRDMGFKTFSDFWDESYDDITDLESRVDAIIDIIKYFSAFDSKKLQKVYRSMKKIVDYNYDFFHNDLQSAMIIDLQARCQDNLKSGFCQNLFES
jgi:hypothetical protein